MDPNSGVGCDQYQNQAQPPQLLGSGCSCDAAPPAGQTDDSMGDNADPSQFVTNYGSLSLGAPVNVATGNVFYQVTDYETAGQNPLRFTRYYNSRGTAYTGLGANWYSNFSSSALTVRSGLVLLYRATGQILTFNQSGSTWATDTDMDLTMVSSGSTITFKDHDDTVEVYTSGQLTSRTFRNGYTQTLHYTSGHLTSVTDTYGRALTFTWNSDGATLASVGTPDGTTISYGYTVSSGSKNLTSVTYPTSPATSVTYSYANTLGTLPNALTQVTDEAGNNFLSWTYDAYGRAITSQKGNGSTANVMTFAYNDSAATTTVTNALGVSDTYTLATYAAIPKIISISRASTSTTAAATESFTYDGYAGVSCSTAGNTGYMCSRTDWNGNKTTFTNNSYGNPTQIVEASGSSVARTTTIAYDTSCVHQPDSVATTGVTTSFTYDSNCEALTKKLADTTSQSVPYSTNGQTRTWTYTWSSYLLLTTKTPNGNTTTFGYDGSSALTSITNPLSQVTHITSFTGGGRPLTILDPNSVTTTKTYDGRQRLLTSSVSTSAGARTTTYDYLNDGQFATIWPDGSILETIVDSAHRIDGLANNLNNQINLTLDSNGDPLTTEYLNPSSTVQYERTATYDALGRKLHDTSVVTGQSKQWTYDKNGNALTYKDELGHTTTNVYDALNRLTKSTDTSSGYAQWTYDAHNRPLTVVDKNSHTTSFVYDGFGDAIQQASPDSGTTVFHYDGDANLIAKTDGAGLVSNMTYDALDRLTGVSYPAEPVINLTYVYDQVSPGYGFSIGRLTTATDSQGFYEHKYDEQGNLLIEARYNTAGVEEYGLVYTYDAANRVASIQYPSGAVSTLTRNGIGQVTSMPFSAPGTPDQTYTVTGINYYPFGSPSGIAFPTGEHAIFTRDLDYHLTGLVYEGVTGTPYINWTYAYDYAGNVSTRTDNITAGDSETFGYDSLNRLTSAADSGWYGSEAWTYDHNGNLTSTTQGGTVYTLSYTSGTNRLSGITFPSNSETYTYNGNGTISGKTLNGATVYAMTYDASGKLTSNSGGSVSPSITGIAYDGFGHRVTKQDASTATVYIYDQFGNLIEENNNGTLTDYIYLGDQLVANYSPARHQLVQMEYDNRGEPFLGRDVDTGTTFSSFAYPQGNLYVVTTTDGLTGPINQPWRLPGQYSDTEELGIFQNGARYYEPAVGRYMQPDPIGLNGGLNPYLYANGNPLSFVDPSGLVSIQDVFQNPKYWSQMYVMAGYVIGAAGGAAIIAELPEAPLFLVGAGCLKLESVLMNPAEANPIEEGLSSAVDSMFDDSPGVFMWNMWQYVESLFPSPEPLGTAPPLPRPPCPGGICIRFPNSANPQWQ